MSEVNQDGTSLTEHSAADLLANLIDETGGIRQPENDDEQQVETEQEANIEEGKTEAEQGQSEQPDTQLVKVKVNGEEIELPLAEVIAGYQKDADYRQKTADLAEQRRTTESERQAVSQERAQLSQQLTSADALLSAQLQQFQSVDWNALLEQDPQGYLRARHQYDTALANLQTVRTEQGRLSEQIQTEQQQSAQQHLASEREALMKAFPQWQDESVAKTDQAALRKYLEGMGYTPDQIKGASDHRALIMADKARRYDELMSKSQQVASKVKTAPPLKVEKPGGNQEPENKRAAEAVNRAKRSGRDTDAAAALLAGGFIR